MPRLSGLLVFSSLLIVLSLTGPLPAPTIADETATSKAATPAKTKLAWTYADARRELELSPRDPYLQYITLQLARGENKTEEVIQFLEQTLGLEPWRQRVDRRNQVDLFNLFSGALAVQESLQLDTMTGGAASRRELLKQERDLEKQKPREKTAEKKDGDLGSKGNHGDEVPPKSPAKKPPVKVASLNGPTIQSHPWEKMLAGRKPAVSELSRCVPDDYFLIEFQSLNKLLEASEISDLWATHVFDQAFHEAVTYDTGNRLRRQLVIETNPLLRPFYDLVVSEVALTGSDLYLRDGSDVTLLFRFTQPLVFQPRMDSFLANARKQHPEARQTAGTYLGVNYVQLETADRSISVISAYPRAGLHVRSNSLNAFRRIIESIQGKGADGAPVRRLGETPEFQFVRTLMPRGAKQEDGFVYLSDPFIRRLVGPQLKLTALRRMRCYNHLKMVGHAATLFQTQYGRTPTSLAKLEKGGCSPGLFGEGHLKCPEGGTYSLAADGTTAVCSHHSSPHFLNPCCEVPVAEVTADEAEDYKTFLNEYSQYWRTFFDPIALRLQVTPERYRLETIVLPLMDNSIYAGLSQVLGGPAEPLDALPVPENNIFSFAMKIDKEKFLKEMGKEPGRLSPFNSHTKLNDAIAREFLEKGIGNQIGFHLCDSVPAFEMNVTGLLGELTGSFRGRRAGRSTEILPIGFLLSSLNSPVYVSIPVQDAAVVDRFLDALDEPLAAEARKAPRRGWFEFDNDFYKLAQPDLPGCRGGSLKLGPFKWRFLWARIGNALYVASQKATLEDLAALEKQRANQPARPGAVDRGPTAHAMVRVRPRHWQKVLPSYRLGWAENNREACLHNLVPLANASRALQSSGKSAADPKFSALVQQHANHLRGGHGFCPDGGHYVATADGKHMECSLHGSHEVPRQGPAPAEKSPVGDLLRQFQDLTATLTFLDDGLHAVVTVDRSPTEPSPKTAAKNASANRKD